MKTLLVANTSWYLYNFRTGLARRLQEPGCEVIAVAPRDEYVARLQAEGIRWVEWKIDRAGMRPDRELSAVRRLVRIYRDEQPDYVHHFTIKSILYGTLAARIAGISRIVNSVTGLGHVFVSKRIAARLARPFIRRWYVWAITTRGVRTMFQNHDDLETLAASAPALRVNAVVTRGSGVDLERFRPKPRHGQRSELRVLFAGRLIAEKGIGEFVEAARICRERSLPVQFVACGEPDSGNPSSVSANTLAEWRNEGLVELPGHVDEIEDVLCESDIVVLPSWREGTPRVLLEAAAMGKALITSDVPGCREVVIDGENGLLAPPRSAGHLAAAIENLVRDGTRRHRMGEAGRKMMVADFDEQNVLDQTMDVYRQFDDHVATAPGRNEAPELERGVFTFSLDFELAWGTRGRPRAEQAPPFLDGTRDAVHGLLSLFEQHGVSGTWAMVGGLFLRSRDSRRHPWLNAAEFADIPIGNAQSHPHWYAEDILERLISCRVPQDLGCHTLTHLFVDASGRSRAALQRELERFLELFEELRLDRPRSFIFPKAGMAHFDVVADAGFLAYRGPEDKWFESLPGELTSAACRVVDAKLGAAPCIRKPRHVNRQLWMIPSSQFYSPFLSVGRHVSVEARVRKAIRGLRRAAATGGVFHLWTHPFNLGVRTDELLEGIDRILAEAARLRDEGQLDVLSMRQIAKQLEATRGRFPAEPVEQSGENSISETVPSAAPG